jgi:hypothetical protein
MGPIKLRLRSTGFQGSLLYHLCSSSLAIVFASILLQAGLLLLPAAAYGQGLHGVTIAKGCVAPLCEGETTSCDIQLGYNDDFGDTIKVLSAWDVQDVGGDYVRVPATGDLPIVNVGGNTTCTIGGALPCRIGPGGSTLSGLPGDPDTGFVRFRQNAYVVQPDDPDVLRDQATVEWEDLCDDPDTVGCGAGVINPAPAPASTLVTDCDDEDLDGVYDTEDNCPYVPNNSGDDIQRDTDGNGIGDACQCGDVSGDGQNNFVDGRLILLGQVPPEHDGKCDVNGDGQCNFVDARLILLGQVSSEHEDQLCPAYQGL